MATLKSWRPLPVPLYLPPHPKQLQLSRRPRCPHPVLLVCVLLFPPPSPLDGPKNGNVTALATMPILKPIPPAKCTWVTRVVQQQYGTFDSRRYAFGVEKEVSAIVRGSAICNFRGTKQEDLGHVARGEILRSDLVYINLLTGVPTIVRMSVVGLQSAVI